MHNINKYANLVDLWRLSSTLLLRDYCLELACVP